MITDCLPSSFKYFLSSINLIFCIISGFILLLGLWLYLENTSFIYLIDLIIKNQHVQIPNNVQEVIHEVNQSKSLNQFGQFFILSGGSLLLFTSLGYFGAAKESRVLLICYGFLMIVLMSFEVVIISVYAGYTKEFVDVIKQFLRYTLTNFYTGAERSSDAITMGFNYIMAEMKCCGIDNYTDFKKARIFQKKKEHYYQNTGPEGCWDRFTHWINNALNPLIICMIVLFILELKTTVIVQDHRSKKTTPEIDNLLNEKKSKEIESNREASRKLKEKKRSSSAKLIEDHYELVDAPLIDFRREIDGENPTFLP
ncbi:unnamed protein product [Lepeophtheirus salmonis]|uniref:(salmon louse) hypothetical protein n=1 Tax=Lepeophtheirus salmonis TaxID=72036 RepID=A0A7R8CUR4_LEPSM|nr:unnamed protein product [Lepeophtheirus salmonis]CAF2936767.1 unnamed protein product [Lepeophtheirus salmonis]